MTGQEKKDFVCSIRHELIEEEHLYLSEEFADDTAEFIVEACEKQIKKKPIDIPDEFGDSALCCPCCKQPIVKNPYSKMQYSCCVKCGQKLLWGN